MLGHSRRQFLKLGAAAVAAGSLCHPRSSGAAPLWVDERQAGPFLFQSTFSLAAYEQLFAELPKLQHDLRGALAVAPARQPISIHLLADQSQHEAYVRERFPNIPYRRALFVRNAHQLSVFAYRQADLETDLRHECTHALLHSDLTTLPLWLDEGLAEYFEAPADQRAYHNLHFDELQWSLRLGIIIDVPALERKRQLTQLTALDYRFAWAWCHFLLHGPKEAHREMTAFLTDLRRGVPAGALSQRLAAVIPQPNEQLLLHFRQWRS